MVVTDPGHILESTEDLKNTIPESHPKVNDQNILG